MKIDDGNAVVDRSEGSGAGRSAAFMPLQRSASAEVRAQRDVRALKRTEGRAPGATVQSRCGLGLALAFALLTLLAPLSARSAEIPKGSFEIELRLVPFNQPDTTVDKLERRRPIINPVSTPTGIEMRQVGVEVVCWARNVLLDDKPFFERFHDGKYIDRLPIARAVLKPGDHVLWPGKHVFNVATNGALSTKDPELLVADGVVRIKAYPVSVRAYRANPDESDLPMSMRVAALPNLTLRDADDALKGMGKGADKSRELLPVYEKFAPLTIWLPADTDTQGYVLHPLGQTFHLGAAGVQAGAGGGAAIAGLNVKESVIEVPVYGFPVEGEPGSKAIVPGVEQYTWAGHEAGARKLTTWYPRKQPYEFKVAEVGPAILVDGDLSKFPIKSFRVATGDRVKGAQRGLVAELTGRHWEPGQPVRASVRVIDPWPIVEADRAARAATNAFKAAQAALGALNSKLTQGTNAWKSATNSVGAKLKALDAAKAKDPDVVTTDLQKDIDDARAKVTDATKALEELLPQVPKAQEKLALAETALTNASAKVIEVEGVNTAENWKPFARLRGEKETAWTTLTTKPVANGVPGELEIPLPATLIDGVYQLELGMAPDDPEALSLRTTVRISVATKKPAGVGLFTLRGRDAFWRGESFWVAVAVLVKGQSPPAGAAVDVDLVDAAGKKFPLLRHKLAAAVIERDTFVVRIPDALSRSLAPGRYRFEAKVGDYAAAPLAFDLVDPEPETHFMNLSNGKYSPLGAAYQSSLRTGRGAEELAREIQSLGYNGFSGMSYDQDRVNRHHADLEQLVRDRPELGPWESHYQASGRDRFMTAALRHNLRFYEDLFTYNDTQVPRLPLFLDASERYASLEIASMRHHPAYLGAALYDEFYWTSIIGLPPSVIVAIDTAEEMAFREKHKDRGLTGARATRAIDRFMGRPAGQRNYEDLATFLTWNEFQDQEWADFSRRIGAVAKDLMPHSANFVFQRQWGGNGGNIAGNGTVLDVQGGLDIATCVMYKDGGYGPRPAYGAIMADILRVRDGQPVWTQIDAHHVSGRHGESQLRNTFFALSQKVEGISFFESGHDAAHRHHTDSADTARNVTRQLTRPYGDFLLALERGYQQVAVYYSRQADHLSQRKQTTVSHSCEGIWVGCMRAGFPADFLYDHQLFAGKGMEYQVIFAPGFTIDQEIAPAVRAALQRLISAGKTIVVERSSKLDLEGVVKLDSELDEFDDKLGGAFPRGLDFEFRQVFDQSEEITKTVREFLAKRIPPAAQHNLLVGPDWQKRGQGQYLFLPNFADPGFSSLGRALHQAPDAPQLRFPRRPPVCYDVLAMKPVTDVKTEGEWMTLTADMRAVPGKLLAFLPTAIAGVKLGAAARVTAGEDLNYAVNVAGADGQAIDAAFPLEIELRDAAGKMVQQVWRAAAPEFRGVYRVGANAPAGRWTLRVRELMSGCVAEAGIEISAGTVPTGTLDARPVWVNEPARVAKFLAGKTPVLIVTDADQAWVRPQAERLQKAFAAKGREARIVNADEVIKLPGEWNMTRAEIDGTRLWRGDVVEPGLFVEAPMVLLGRRYESRLIEALIRRDVLPEPLTANFPGRGRALVNVTAKAFSNYHDTLSILSQDEAGLTRGVDAALAPEAGKGTEVVAPVVTRSVPDPKAALAAGEAKAKAPSSMADAIAWPDWVRMVDVDAATGRTVVGTAGYGDNLFCLAADGTLLWKTFLPEHNVYFAGFIDDGKKIVAATGRGWLCFILDAKDGKVLRKFATTGWADFHYTEGPVDTEVPIVINTKLRQVLLLGRTGILAVDFEGKRMWLRDRAEAIATYPVEAEQSLAAEFSRSVVLANAQLSPDGTKIVHGEFVIVGSTPGKVPGTVDTLWAFRPMIIEVKTGKVLAEGKDDPGSSAAPRGWSVSWPAGSAVPFAHTKGLAIPLKEDASLGTPQDLVGRALADGGTLVLDRHEAVRRDAKGKPLWRITAPETVLPDLDLVSADAKRLYRCDRDGNITCHTLADGKLLWTQKLPFGAVMHATGDTLTAGDKSGRVARVDATGKLLWQTQLAKLHELPGTNYAAHVQTALLRDVDSTADFFPVNDDQPGEYDQILRHGIEQLTNGGFESDDAWKAVTGKLEFVTPGFAGKRALALNGQLVTQAVGRRVVPSATYLLEFRYRLEGAGATLTAGVELKDGAKSALTASEFKGRPGQWLFGRLAVKSYAGTKSLEVGFEAVGGRVVLDEVSLRAVRFPSANLLADPELAAVEPTFVRDIRVQYDRIPQTLRSRLMNRSHVAGYKQGPSNVATIYTQEQAFLHNGRLDDVGAVWSYQPDVMGFSVVMPKPAYVSHLVIYLNNARPDDVYTTLSILANNTKTKVPESVALVRGNKKRFIVVHFAKPVFTDSMKILPLYRAHHESITEIEVYGPLGGPEQEGGPQLADAEAWPMFMGGPTHVPAKLPADFAGDYEVFGSQRLDPAFHAGATVMNGVLTLADPAGQIRSLQLPAPDAPARDRRLGNGPTWPLQTITPTTTPARHLGRLLVGSADNRLHAVADNGTYLWGFPTGGRVYSSPVPDGDDVYFGSDDGRLYKLDVHSGTLLWEFATGGDVRGSAALAGGRVIFASGDGFCYAVDAASGLLVWKAPVAPHTRGSVAVSGGRVYVGDEQGVAHCFAAADGKELWKKPVGGYVTACPLVTPDGVFFLSEQGDAALFGTDGKVRWQRRLDAFVSGQPIATETQVLVPTTEGLQVLVRADGKADERFVAPSKTGKVLAVLAYQGKLLLVTGQASVNFKSPPRTYALYDGAASVWQVKGSGPAAKPAPRPPAKAGTAPKPAAAPKKK